MYKLLTLFFRQAKRNQLRENHLSSNFCSFEDCVRACSIVKMQRRPRTHAEFRSVSAKMMRLNPTFAQSPLNALRPKDCADLLTLCFTTQRQRLKGHVILHGIFAYGLRMRWCDYNPVASLDKPLVQESEIELLSWTELRRLLRVARKPEHCSCLPALGLMLWAGIRPSEVARLDWNHIDWQEEVVVVPAQHAKTGGCRHVSLYPALKAILSECDKRSQGRICPPNWGRQWRRLRDAAGLVPWRQDVLRHCFASYHIKRWHDYTRLQVEMGHRSADLLRTRYLSMRGISTAQAKAFWQVGSL